MNSDDLCHHVSDMMSAACSLEYLRDQMEQEHRYGEAYILDLIRKTISEGAEAFSMYEVEEQVKKAGKGKPAGGLELVRK
ncbi:hypothetical protein [Maridesulfovibrio frigidus]|uniref:hypothetical protein n=1 Tax=Maridesulfovibrio frigidus TaxID=340956 RepID=UPI0004E124EC|nr:hypothetical protein [Maridesulfovibrio frigidus]